MWWCSRVITVHCNLEGSVSVEVPVFISDDGLVTTSSKYPMLSSSSFLTSIYKTPNISITSIIPKISPRLTPKSLMMPSPHNADIPITTNSSPNKTINNTTLTKNSCISSLDHVTNKIGMYLLYHVREKASIEDEYLNFNYEFNSDILSG